MNEDGVLRIGPCQVFIDGVYAGESSEMAVALVPTASEWPDVLLDDILDAEFVGDIGQVY